MFVTKGQEDSIQFMKKLRGKRIGEVLRSIIANLDQDKLKNPLLIPEDNTDAKQKIKEFGHEKKMKDKSEKISEKIVQESDVVKADNKVIDNNYKQEVLIDNSKEENVNNKLSDGEKDDKNEKSIDGKNGKNKRKRSKSKTKKDLNESKQSDSVDKKDDSKNKELKTKSENQNPKSKTTQIEIDHSLITDNSELMQKLEETLLLKKRTRSRSKTKNTDLDASVNLTPLEVRSKKSSKESNESNNNPAQLISKKLSKESNESNNSYQEDNEVFQPDVGTKSIKN